MGSVRATPHGFLYFDFRQQGVRCREHTTLPDTPLNRRRMEQALARIEAEILAEVFDYAQHFPDGRHRNALAAPGAALGQGPAAAPTPTPAAASTPQPAGRECEQFARQWYADNEAGWKPATRAEFACSMARHLIPHFRGRNVTSLTTADAKRFRKHLVSLPGRHGKSMGPKRVNNILAVPRLICTEASQEDGTPNPFAGFRQLSVPKTDIDPFTLEELLQFLAGVREDFRPYYTVRFFTGMRPGEIDALRWGQIDWLRRKVLVRQTRSRGEFVPPKTAPSYRDIDMLPPRCARRSARRRRGPGGRASTSSAPARVCRSTTMSSASASGMRRSSA